MTARLGALRRQRLPSLSLCRAPIEVARVSAHRAVPGDERIGRSPEIRRGERDLAPDRRRRPARAAWPPEGFVAPPRGDLGQRAPCRRRGTRSLAVARVAARRGTRRARQPACPSAAAATQRARARAARWDPARRSDDRRAVPRRYDPADRAWSRRRAARGASADRREGSR